MTKPASSTLIDHVICNFSQGTVDNVTVDVCFSDHSATFTHIPHKPDRQNVTVTRKCVDFGLMKERLQVDFPVQKYLNPNAFLDDFLKIFNDVLSGCTTTKTSTAKADHVSLDESSSPRYHKGKTKVFFEVEETQTCQ